MKIEIKNKDVKFEKVPIGYLFVYPGYSCSESDVYMAVEEYKSELDKVNAVCLCDGSLHEFHEDDNVRLLDNAKVIIG